MCDAVMCVLFLEEAGYDHTTLKIFVDTARYYKFTIQRCRKAHSAVYVFSDAENSRRLLSNQRFLFLLAAPKT